MGSKRKGASASAPITQAAAPEGLILREPLYDEESGLPAKKNALIESCMVVFRKVLAPNGFNLKPGFLGAGSNESVHYSLVGSGSTPATAGRYDYHVFPLDPERQFWVACKLVFKPERSLARLIAVSLVFFRGSISGAKQPVLRAEWDCISHINTAASAQPHWHVYQVREHEWRTSANELTEVSVVQSIDDDTTPTAEPDDTKVGGSNFHLAMAARWHDEGSQSHQVPLSVPGVVGWIEGCIEYTRQQLLAR